MDDITCFICKKSRHISSKCTNKSTQELTNTNDDMEFESTYNQYLSDDDIADETLRQ